MEVDGIAKALPCYFKTSRMFKTDPHYQYECHQPSQGEEVIKLFQGFILLLVFRLDQYFPYISSEILHATDSLYFKIQFHACTHSLTNHKKNLTGFSPDRSRQNRRTEEKTLHIGLEVYCTQYNWIYLDISLLDIYLDTYQAAPFYIQQRWIFGFLDKREVSAYWTGGEQFCVGHHSI